MTASYARNRGITLTRLFDAPPEAVFSAWTDPAQLGWFFNPGMPVDMETTVDLRVGGQWRQLMVPDATTRYVTGGVYRAIEPGRRLVFTWGATDGWPAIDLDHLDDSALATVLFEPEGHGTRMTFRLQFPDHMPDDKAREWLEMGVDKGWGMTIDRLFTQFRPLEAVGG